MFAFATPATATAIHLTGMLSPTVSLGFLNDGVLRVRLDGNLDVGAGL